MTTQKTVVIPRSKEERAKIKEGFVEDNNDAIAYLDFRLIVPSAIITVFSIVVLICAIVLSIWFDEERLKSRSLTPWLNVFGWAGSACINATANDIPKHWMPSILRLFELNVFGNILFRIATIIPIAIRLFNSFITQSNNNFQHANNNPLYHFCNTVTPYLLFAELFSCALFSVITIRQDFPEIHRNALFIFVISATLHMLTYTATSFQNTQKDQEKIDQFSSIVKAISLIGFGFTAPQFLASQQQFIDFPSCHPYVPPSQAIYEYLTFVSNAAFHLTTLIDIRHSRFVCYPRTASGECEPLKPANFRAGGPFEHCRSWELAQRQSEFNAKPTDQSKTS